MTGKQEAPTVVEALAAVMEDVRAVGKGDRNQSQGWSFRGVDSVVNAVAPALRRHRVVVVPDTERHEITEAVTSSGKPMRFAAVTVRYTFHGPAGDTITARVSAEAGDTGDKATAKAHSVALRTALLQALMLPTDEPDPDHDVYEVAVPAAEFDAGDPESWPDRLSQAQAKRVVLFVAGDDRELARQLWDGELAGWSGFPAAEVEQWVASR